jgi:hypothetical protein
MVSPPIEDYDSFGSEVVSKFNVIWHATDQVALRAVGTVSRALAGSEQRPGPHDVLRSGHIAPAGTFPVTSSVAHYGAQPLKPEVDQLWRRRGVYTFGRVHDHNRPLRDQG